MTFNTLKIVGKNGNDRSGVILALKPDADNRSAGLAAYRPPLRGRPPVVHLCVGEISIR
jgi:hypothetical protein